jgi:hypothetical protein
MSFSIGGSQAAGMVILKQELWNYPFRFKAGLPGPGIHSTPLLLVQTVIFEALGIS